MNAQGLLYIFALKATCWQLIPLSVLVTLNHLLKLDLSPFAFFYISALLLVGFGVDYARTIKSKIEQPLMHLRTALEDHAEGFIHTEMPEHLITRADPLLRTSMQLYIDVNRNTLRQIDSLERGYEEERRAKLEQVALTNAYEKFVPKQFIRFLNKNSITSVRLGDQVRTHMSVLYSDIRSFTTLSEQLTPDENFRLLNSYLMVMEPAVIRHHGFIDKFIGDAILALFHNRADDAVAASVDMLHTLRAWNEGRIRAGYVPLSIGIGINTGPMMLGIVGGENRMEVTVISDAVNLVARIEELNKVYGTALLLSEFTHQQLHHPESFAMRYIDKVLVKGKTHAVRIYEVFDMNEPALREGKIKTLSIFEHACNLYHDHKSAEALPLFLDCIRACPDDKIAGIYIERCHSISKLHEGGPL
jgi:class 3 adenylate cyclase